MTAVISCFVTSSLLTKLRLSLTPKEPCSAKVPSLKRLLFELEVSLKKIEVLHQPATLEEYRPPHIGIDGTELKAVHQFPNVVCNITSDGKIDKEVDKKLAKANTTFGRLYKKYKAVSI